MQITVILTCFNRKIKTVNCIQSLINGNPEYNLNFIVVDDNSTDGTEEAIKELDKSIKVLKGTGKLYWAGGMRVGIDYFFKNNRESEYVLLVNDDVFFFNNIICSMINKSKKNKNAVIVGVTCEHSGNMSYGGMKLVDRHRGTYRYIGLNEKDTPCDLFNCNCVLLKSEIMRKTGNFDPIYIHGLADLDYGLKLSRSGNMILISDDYVGVCDKNSEIGTWKDKTLLRKERLKKKESPKGAPFRIWFYYIHKNFGLLPAIRYSLNSYFKILAGK